MTGWARNLWGEALQEELSQPAVSLAGQMKNALPRTRAEARILIMGSREEGTNVALIPTLRLPFERFHPFVKGPHGCLHGRMPCVRAQSVPHEGLKLSFGGAVRYYQEAESRFTF